MSGFRGGKGGGRGGGSSSGMSRSGVQMPSMGILTWTDLTEVDKQKPTKSYPPMEEEPKLSKVNEIELKTINYQLEFLKKCKDSIWWPMEENNKSKMKDIPRYSDRYRQDQTTLQGDGAAKAIFSLKDESVINTLQKDAFPSQLWNLYMNAETKRQEKEKKREQARNSGRKDWERLLQNVENMTSGEQTSDKAPSDGEEPALDEYEDDEEDDYADNYFDNGEGDDIPEEGGEGAEETYE